LAAQLISALASATLGVVVTLVPIAQNGWPPWVFGFWFFASLFSYLLVRLVLHNEFETASLRTPLLLAIPLFVSAVMLFFAGSATLTELAVAGGIAVAAVYLARRFSALGRGFVEITLLFHFLLLLNGTIYAELPPGTLRLRKKLTGGGQYVATVAGLGLAECVVALLFYFAVKPTLPF
jgi:hypothetical protein